MKLYFSEEIRLDAFQRGFGVKEDGITTNIECTINDYNSGLSGNRRNLQENIAIYNVTTIVDTRSIFRYTNIDSIDGFNLNVTRITDGVNDNLMTTLTVSVNNPRAYVIVLQNPPPSPPFSPPLPPYLPTS